MEDLVKKTSWLKSMLMIIRGRPEKKAPFKTVKPRAEPLF